MLSPMRRLRLASASSAAAVLTAAAAYAQEPPAPAQPPTPPAAAEAQPVQPPSTPAPQPAPALVRITLTNGDTFHAVIVTDADPLVIEHPLIGRMSIAKERIKSIDKIAENPVPPPAPAPAPTPAPPPPPAAPAPPPAEVAVVAPPPPPPAPTLPVAPPPEPSLLDLWKFAVELGMNGTAGATPRQNFRALINGNRSTPEMVTTAALGWWYARADDEDSQERVQIDGRNEWAMTPNSPWTYFVSGRSEYDQFQPWDWRLSGQAGIGCKLLSDETLTLTTRTGFGASREFGTAHPDVHAELTPCLDLEWRINPRNKICASVFAAVDLEDSDRARANFKAWYEVMLDPEHGMALKLGVEDRYEASPGSGREKHEVDYYAVIVFNF